MSTFDCDECGKETPKAWMKVIGNRPLCPSCTRKARNCHNCNAESDMDCYKCPIYLQGATGVADES